MKTQKLLLGLAIVLMTLTASIAQEKNETHMRILPHANEGYLRLLYVGENISRAKVTIKKDNKTFGRDYVRVNKSDNGFIKSYDLSKLRPGTYSVEVLANGKTSSETFEIINNEPIWVNYWKNKLNINNNSRLATTVTSKTDVAKK